MNCDFEEEAIATLLGERTKDSSIKYSAMGMNYLPTKHPINKPKPNTRFLRNLVLDTDSHNAALLAKEAAESKLRLDQLVNKEVRTEKDIRRRQLGNISAILGANASRTRRGESSLRRENEHTGTFSRKKEHEDQSRDKIDRQRRRTGNDDEDEDAGSHRLRRSRCREAEHSRTNSEHDSRSSHRMRSLSPRDQKLTDTRRRDRSPHRQSHSKHEDNTVGRRCGPHSGSRRSQHDSDATSSKSRPRKKSSRRPHPGAQQDPHHSSRPGRTPPVDDDSDPLETIVGPLPPPKIKARGRGTVSAGSGIDGRFSDTYDPSLDLTTGDAGDGDDWDMVLDRVKWRQQGAERLRAAGFTEQEVQGWETGKKPEFRWAKNGEGREWDRGKTDLV